MKNIANENSVNTDYLVWVEKTEPIGRYIYEPGKTPRQGVGTYQRMYSAASRLDKGMVDWKNALKNAKLFHTTGISFGLPLHSHYERNNIYDCFLEAVNNKPTDCMVGMDFNYRSTLWPIEKAKKTLTNIIENHVDILIASIEDMALFYNFDCGKYSKVQILNGDICDINDEDILSLSETVHKRFGTKIFAVTKKYSESIENIKLESIAVDNKGNISRTKSITEICVAGPLGGGDAWLSGFYYGLLTEGFNEKGMEKDIIIGDVSSRLKHTLMFDLPIISKEDIKNLIISDIKGGKRVIR